jgi:hypothetical protein
MLSELVPGARSKVVVRMLRRVGERSRRDRHRRGNRNGKLSGAMKVREHRRSFGR